MFHGHVAISIDPANPAVGTEGRIGKGGIGARAHHHMTKIHEVAPSHGPRSSKHLFFSLLLPSLCLTPPAHLVPTPHARTCDPMNAPENYPETHRKRFCFHCFEERDINWSSCLS